jgi:uncharacterized membrane protein
MGSACFKFCFYPLFSGVSARFIKIGFSFLGWRWRKKVFDSTFLYALGITLIFVGVVVIVAAVLLFVLGGGKGKFEGGGAVIIGPVPIIFGTDKKSLKTVLLLSLALTVTLVVAMVLYYLLLR